MTRASSRRCGRAAEAGNLLNSAAALAGLRSTSPSRPRELPARLAAVAISGAWLGAWNLPPRALRYILSALLLIGGVWMLVGKPA